jgi:hypothetical protein
MLRALEVLLREAELESQELEELARRVGKQERDELMRLHGHVVPRKRFKGRKGQPLLEVRPRDLLYADEAGRSIPQPGEDNAIFALGGISLTQESAADYVTRAEALKQEFFGDKVPTFHEPVMRNHEGPFYFGGDAGKQRAFDDAVVNLISGSRFTAFGIAIRKSQYQRDFVDSGLDPYLPIDVYSVAIQMLLERYIDYLAFSDQRPMGVISFESIGPKEDAEHLRDFGDLLLYGTQWVPDAAFRSFLETGVSFLPKSGSSPSELADMWARDLFEWARAGCTGEPGRWRLFESCIYRRGDMQMGKFGVKVFPDSDIRPLIEEHRSRVAAGGKN